MPEKKTRFSNNNNRNYGRKSSKINTNLVNSSFNNNNFLKFGLINIHSIRNKLTTVSEILDETQLDLLCITETWLHVSETNVVKSALPKNYTFVHVPRSSDPGERGGGVAVIFKDCFTNFKLLSNFHSTNSFEVLAFSICSLKISFNIAVVYRPGHAGTDLSFYDDFNEFLSSFTDLGNHFLICGDFNYWVDNPIGKLFTLNFISLLDSHNCTNVVNEPTHSAGHTLDLIIHDQRNHSIDNLTVFPISPKISDHSLITFIYNVPKKRDVATKEIQFRNYKNLNLDNLKNYVNTIVSNFNYTSPLVNQVNDYNSNLEKLHDKHCPLLKKVIRVDVNNPWYDSSISKLRKERRKAEREWRRNKNENTRKIYVNARDKVNNTVELQKTKYYSDSIKKCNNNQKQLYKVLTKLIGSDDILLPANATCNDMNNFFLDKISTIRNQLDNSIVSNKYSDSYLNYNVDYGQAKLSKFNLVSECEVKKIMTTVNKSSCGLDPFNFSKAPDIVPDLIPIFTSIINNCFSSGKFPTSEKVSLVRPLLKKTSLDPEILKNYRPVSNLTYLHKLIEKSILSQLLPHLMKNNCISKFRSAYRSNHSTKTALCRVYNDLLKNIQNAEIALLIMLDLSAAFDTIDFDLLFDDLKKAGVTDDALNLLKSYITERFQKVAMNGDVSSSQELKYGVPQGSVLGPILFSLYASKLAEIMEAHGVKFHLYADDTQIYMPITNIDSSKEKIDLILNDIKIWMHDRKLQLNESKTEVFLIKGPLKNEISNSEDIQFINNIKTVNSVKNLGIIFDSKLNFNNHFNHIVKTCNFHLRRLSSVIKYLDKNSAKTLIHAFITSRIDYCNSLFVNLPKKDLKRLQGLLNRAARLIYKLPPFTSISPYLYELHWLPVIARIEFKINLLVFRALKSDEPEYLRDLLENYKTQSNVILRAADDPNLLVVPRLDKHSVYGSRAFSYAGPFLFNQLPLKIKEENNIDTFKTKLKTHIFKKCFNDETKTINPSYKT